jgi:hypothetical protein
MRKYHVRGSAAADAAAIDATKSAAATKAAFGP